MTCQAPPYEIRTVDVLRDLWGAKRTIITGSFIGLAIALICIACATPNYRTTLIISAANPMNGSEMSSLLADDNLFALRYMVQRIGVANASDFMNFENIFKGPSVAAILLKDKNIIAGLHDDKAIIFLKPQQEFTAEKLAEYIQKRVHLSNIGTGSLRQMIYFHHNKKFAQYFLTRLHTEADALIRQKIKQESTERVSYLNKAVQETYNPEHRKALTTLLLEQERLLMLTSIDQPYAAAIIEPASSSSTPRWPDKPLIIVIMTLIGAAIGFITHGLRTPPAQSPNSGH